MNKLEKHITDITICLLFTTAMSCTHIATMNKSTQKFPELKKGNLISIVFIDLTQIKCVFLEKTENGEHIQRLVDINSVLRIDKLKIKPNTIILIAVGWIAFSMLAWASYNVGLGHLGS